MNNKAIEDIKQFAIELSSGHTHRLDDILTACNKLKNELENQQPKPFKATDIRFVGERVDGKGKVEGFHYMIGGLSYIMLAKSEVKDREDGNGVDTFNPAFEVHPESVEQIGGGEQWISVEDRLPEVGKNVLIKRLTFPDLKVAHCSDSGSWYDSNNYEYIATHWMPLPNPPKQHRP
jgi:hypothetical protein